MRDIFSEIWNSVRRNKLRTCLTGFAVAWGIFMLIVLLGAGNGLINAILQGSEGVSLNTMTVSGGVTSKPYGGLSEGRSITLEASDMDVFESESLGENVDEVMSSIYYNGTAVFGKNSASSCLVYGVYPGYLGVDGIKISSGRFINETDLEQRRKTAVFSDRLAEMLLGDGRAAEELVGKDVRIDHANYKVVGISKTDMSSYSQTIYVPFSTVLILNARGNDVDEITFTFHGLETEAENEAFMDRVRAAVNTRHNAAPDDRSAVWIWNTFLEKMQIDKALGMVTTGLWVIGLLTLLSGIVGVSNIMLITVKERTHEFGIRKSIGARPWHITRLILSESIVITAFFGYIGMAAGMFACEVLDRYVANNAMEVLGESVMIFVNPTVGLDVALQATLLLVVAGTVAGLFPARKAAKVRPIEALRVE